MTHYAIGRPGEAPRIIVQESQAGAQAQCREGECAVAVAGRGAWIMAEDGVTLSPMPVTLDQARAKRIADVRAEAARRIEEIAPLYRQANALRGEGSVDFAAIDAVRAASNAAQAAISVATTVEAVAMIDLI